MSIVKDLRLRLAALLALIVLSVLLGGSPTAVTACETCVFPTGGICVACSTENGGSFNRCSPNQDDCSCTVSGGSCGLPD